MSSEYSSTDSVFESLYNDNSYYGYLYSHTYDSDNSLSKVYRTSASGSVSTITLSGLSSEAKITSLSNGDYAATWRSGSNLYTQLKKKIS